MIPATTFNVIHLDPLPLDIDAQVSSYMAESRQGLDDILTTVASKARGNTLPNVTLMDVLYM